MAQTTDYYTQGYEHTIELVQQALDAGFDIKTVGKGWQTGPDGLMFQAESTLTRPDGRTLTLDGWAERGDAQSDGADPQEPAFKIMARARVRAARAVARVALGMAVPEDEGQPDWQRQLQMLMRQVGDATGTGRDAVADEVARMFGVESTADLSHQQAAMAIREMGERLTFAREG